ncbi:MAG TPA: CinA family nicotinamide mononucleotide deamidase-related protein [Candidatus Hydrogenedentes bacterium]|nr:CinA family nicotinamide mononucleotide deamidase-related protein [Candidatus Hydrogenedentota bacterium]
MRAEMIMIGTELLLGQIVDANAAYMGRVLAEHGIPLYQKTTVGDNQERIVRALHAALDRADVLLLSGGLGPTEDDLTRESIAALLNRPLEFREELLAQVTARFARMRRPMTENNRKQAFAPAGAIAIENPNGTAPGLIVEDERGVIIAMPGVPSELEAMLTERVVPYLRQKYGIAGLLDSRVLKIAGIGESRVDAVIGDLIQTQKNPTIGILASPDAVRIRITALAQCRTEAENMIAEVEGKLRRRLPQSIFGKDNDTLEAVVDGLFAQRGWSLATAETVSGGVIAQRLRAAGAVSFAGGTVLGDPANLSPQTNAETLAESVRAMFHADCALAMVPRDQGAALDAVFATPDSRTAWQLPLGDWGRLTALRVGVAALECLRRALLGIHTDDPGNLSL